jgi:hypothetical protein
MVKKLNKNLYFLLAVFLIFTFSASPAPAQTHEQRSLEGRYVGYSWRGEVNGTPFADSDQYIETILELDESGIIKDVKMRFFVKKDGFWIMRQSGNAYVDIDFSIDPQPAVPGDDYTPGESMFAIYTADMMSFYAVAVDPSGVAAVAVVDPITRYQFEMKFDPDFDYNMPMSRMTIGSGRMVPTIRTSTGAFTSPTDWETFADNTLFNLSRWSHVVNDYGILRGITHSSSVGQFLAALGVQFDGERPQPMPVRYGYFGMGGWDGNYRAIEASLRGQNAKEKTSLIDWSIPRYQRSVNEQNQFGVDVQTGATRTVQNTTDGISGATVRMSRESTSYQRALVDAGILDEADVIVGRF